MAISNTSICNMALGRLGAKRINDYSDSSESSVEAIQCRLHYEQTRDALIRSHEWRCTRCRATLSENATTPDFEWDHAYDLPADFLRMRPVYEGAPANENIHYSYALEGKQLLSNEDSIELRYIKKVTDPTEFDPLFIEVLVLQLAIKMVMPLSQDRILRRELHEELWGTPQQKGLMSRVRALDKQETNSQGRNGVTTLNDVFASGGSEPMYL